MRDVFARFAEGGRESWTASTPSAQRYRAFAGKHATPASNEKAGGSTSMPPQARWRNRRRCAGPVRSQRRVFQFLQRARLDLDRGGLGGEDALLLGERIDTGALLLGELQATCEQLLGHRLDKSSFRRRLADRDLVEPIEGATRGGPFRPAQLFRRRGC